MKITNLFCALALLASLVLLAGPAPAAAQGPYTIEVSQATYLTANGEYDRNPSIVHDGSQYWLFYTKGDDTSTSGVRGSYNPDADTYVVYYKTAATIAGLASAGETKLGLSETARPANFDQRVVSATYFGGKVYAFVSSGQSGTDRGLYYYEYVGGSWSGPTTLIADSTARGGHVNVTSDASHVYIVWESSDGSSDCYTWDGTTLSAKVDISSDNMPRVTLMGSTLYAVSIEDGTGDIEIYSAAAGALPAFSSHSTAISGAGLYDPVILNDGSTLYVVSAPYDGPNDRQYLVQTRYTGGSWAAARTVSYGGYGSDTWWEYWPMGYWDGSDLYVFFTTETNSPTFSDGEIAYVKMDWNLDNDHYFYIQNAVNQAASGDTISIAAGTYTEQVTLQKSLDLIGASESTTTIQAPASRSGSVAEGSSTRDYIVGAYAATGTIDVRIEGFTVDANGQAKTPGTDEFVGVFLRDVDGSGAGLYASTIQGFGTTEYESWGVQVYGDSSLTLDGNTLTGYTRDGIIVYGDDGAGADPDVVISDNSLTGSGIPLNGITVGRGATGTVSGNTVRNHTRSSPWAAVGILIYKSDGVTVGGGNTVENCHYGILLLEADDSTVSGNTLKENVAFHIGLDNANNNQVSDNTIMGTSSGTEDKAIGFANGATGNVVGGSTAADGNAITLATSGDGPLYAVYVQSGVGSNTIQYNTIHGAKRSVQVDGGNTGTTTVADNTIGSTGPSFAGIYLNGGNAIVTDNALTNATRPIEFWGAMDVTVSGNTINGSTFDGINAGSASGSITISDNKIFNMPGLTAIHARDGADNLIIDGNEIYGSYKAVVIESGCTGAQITGNYIHDNNFSAIELHETVNTITCNTLEHNWRGIETWSLITAHDNNILYHQYGGLILHHAGTHDVENNWWDDASGPNVDGGGPGTGTSIVTNGNALDYDPWRTSEAVCAPTAITLISFTALAAPDGVTLAWETGTEIDNAGFNLYRAAAADGPYTRINAALIAARGDPVAGACYSYTDAPGYGTFFYKLEDIDYYGVSTLRGPVQVTVALPFRRPLRRPTAPR